MLRVLLVHAGIIPHYRVPIYGYLSEYLKRHGIDLVVTSNSIQPGCSDSVEFQYIGMRLSTLGIVRLIHQAKIDIVIDYMELKHRYLFPTYFIAKGILRRKIVYWGQGRDLLDPGNKIKNVGYTLELSMSSAIILYAEHLKKYLPERFFEKVFIANNTLCLNYAGFPPGITRERVLAKYNISSKKNIICVGRMQRRKRMDHLFEALALMNRPDIGLILIGPDSEGVLDCVRGDNIHYLGPLYGQEKFDVLSSADVYCLPGAVGLSVVDAFYCGLPLVTEEGDESAEIMYLKDGVNGFIVPRGNIPALTQKLQLLLDNDELRSQFSKAARREITEDGSMDRFCSGFRDALFYAAGQALR